MSDTHCDANCDLVLELEQLGVGVEEILEYARGILCRDEIRALVQGLKEILDGCRLSTATAAREAVNVAEHV